MNDAHKPEKNVIQVLGAPLSLSVVAGAAAGYAVFNSWPVLALGGLTYAALVASDLLATKGKPQPAPEAVRPVRAIEDEETRGAAEALARAREELTRVLGETPKGVREHLGAALLSLRELDARADTLVERAASLSRYLASVDVGDARKSRERLERKLGESRDAEAREKYDLAKKALDERLATVEDIGHVRERVLANLSHLTAALSGVAAKLVRMHALDDETQDALGGDIHSELQRMNVELKAFEETLQTLAEMA